MGGGRRHFENNGFFDNQSIWSEEYGWSTVTDNATAFIDQLDDIDTSIMPFMGLWGVSSFYHLHSYNFNDPELLAAQRKRTTHTILTE